MLSLKTLPSLYLANFALIDVCFTPYLSGFLDEAACISPQAAAQQKPESAAAWERLGLVLAENEQESAAIIACRKCLELDPRNSSALLSLARSYTNEMLNRDACLALQRWLAAQDRYQHLVTAEDLENNQLGNMNQFVSQ